MGKTQRGVRDGSGSFEGSWQDQNREVGRRQEAGEICPVNDSEDKSEKEIVSASSPEVNTIFRGI